MREESDEPALGILKPSLISLKGVTNKVFIDLHQACLTADSLDGTCIQLNNCSSLNSIYMKKPVSITDKLFLRNSRCQGANEDSVYVCCREPSQHKTIRTTTTRRPVEVTTEVPGKKLSSEEHAFDLSF